MTLGATARKTTAAPASRTAGVGEGARRPGARPTKTVATLLRTKGIESTGT